MSSRKTRKTTGSRTPDGAAFLLAQIGAHAAMRFAQRMEPLGLSPPQSGMLRILGSEQGMTQQALATTLGILPSRLVALVDGLEERGLIERRANPEDRRSYALHLTAAGRATLDTLGRTALEHEQALCAALTVHERQQLQKLLARIAEEQGLTPGVHPGYRRMGPPRGAG
jgi:DNA-binding MarR family transcriptional regulator